jgi:hypothetical protein
VAAGHALTNNRKQWGVASHIRRAKPASVH